MNLMSISFLVSINQEQMKGKLHAKYKRGSPADHIIGNFSIVLANAALLYVRDTLYVI